MRQLFGGKVGAPALDVLTTAVSQRLVDGVRSGRRHRARRPTGAAERAERDDQSDEVEDQLFRFGRVLDAEPRLNRAAQRLHGARPRRGIALLDKVLDTGSGVNATASGLLSQTIELLRGERADEAVIDLAELAVARRGEVVAHVTAAADLSDAQRTRLTEVLTRIYGHSGVGPAERRSRHPRRAPDHRR